MDLLDVEIDVFDDLVKGRLAREPGYTRVHTVPGIGPVLGAGRQGSRRREPTSGDDVAAF
jgi:hypothetical protein